LTGFLALVKPACIKKTKNAATRVQTTFIKNNNISAMQGTIINSRIIEQLQAAFSEKFDLVADDLGALGGKGQSQNAAISPGESFRNK